MWIIRYLQNIDAPQIVLVAVIVFVVAWYIATFYFRSQPPKNDNLTFYERYLKRWRVKPTIFNRKKDKDVPQKD